MAWIRAPLLAPLLFFLHYHYSPLPFLHLPSCRDDCLPEFPAHHESQNGPAIPPGHSRVRQGKTSTVHPNCGDSAHRVGLSARRTKSPPMLLNTEPQMNYSISSSISDRAIPRNTPSTHPTSSRTRSRVRKRSAMRNSSTISRTPDSPIRRT